MGKRKPPVIKKRKGSAVKMEGCDLKCSSVGCAARFKTAEVLLLHQQCHIDSKDKKMLANKTTDGQSAAFACPHCSQR